MENFLQDDDPSQLRMAFEGRLSEEIQDVVVALRRAVDAMVGLDCSFAERERAALSVGNEAQRRLLEQELQSIAEAQGRELLINDVLYREHQPRSREYVSLCGPLHVSRSTYRLAGVRNGPTEVPLDLEAGLMEGATPAMVYSVALGYAKSHSRGVEEDLRAAHRVPPSRTKLEKISKCLGASAQKEVRRIEGILRQGERLPEGARGISLGLDRTSVPMEETRLEGTNPKTDRKKRDKPYIRTPPAPVDVNYRMAYVGTFCITDEYGDGLVTRRYSATPEQGPDEILHGMMADVRNALRRNSRLPIGVVQDGAPEMWNLVRAALTKTSISNWLEAIDRYHLNERIAKVLKILEPRPGPRQVQQHQWNVEFDQDDCTIDRIEQCILVAMTRSKDSEHVSVLQENATFIANNKDRMRYVALRKAYLPVGSGATEGSCRYVIGDRTNRGSRRWHETGLAAALTLRSIYCSERLPRFFTHLQKLYTADVREAEWESDTVA